MTDGLRDALQATLGATYSIERELGGGGMSRVFVARDLSLQRDVVIKIVAPELRETLSAERFTREVQVAARLQQANIVPVLTAGERSPTRTPRESSTETSNPRTYCCPRGQRS